MYKLISVFSIVLMSVQAFAATNQSKQDAMVQDLEAVKYAMSIRYAPQEWKQSHFGWDLDSAFDQAKTKIYEIENITSKDYHRIFNSFLKSTKDYHVNTKFYSTEWSFFPFSVKGLNGKYYLRSVSFEMRLTMEDYLLSETMDPIENGEMYERQLELFHPGDEFIALNGISIAEVIENIIDTQFGGDRTPTGYALAEKSLFIRLAKYGADVPSGLFDITVRHKGSSEVVSYQFPWLHIPEWIMNKAPKQKAKYSPLEAALKRDFTVHYANELFAIESKKFRFDEEELEEELEDLREKGFLPELGEILWESDDFNDIYAYLYRNHQGRKIGYMYLKSFNYDTDEADYLIDEILEAMERFEEADALVLDITNNGGGSAFYMYAVLAILADKPLETFSEREIIIQEDVYRATIASLELSQIEEDEDVEEISIGGYLLDKPSLQGVRDYFNHIIDNWEAGKTITDSYHFFGIEKINPHPRGSFAKPILLLINELDFSCADLFPMILQDNGRATLFGKKTAGAGGCVKGYSHTSRFGVVGYTLTASHCTRKNGDPIENLGVTPDIPYEITVRDLTENYVDYVEALNREVENLLVR